MSRQVTIFWFRTALQVTESTCLGDTSNPDERSLFCCHSCVLPRSTGVVLQTAGRRVRSVHMKTQILKRNNLCSKVQTRFLIIAFIKPATSTTPVRPLCIKRDRHLAGSLKKWCKKKKPLNQELNSLEEQIKNIQKKPLHEQDHNMEAALVCRFEENLTKLTQFYSQRAKKHWATKGDRKYQAANCHC